MDEEFFFLLADASFIMPFRALLYIFSTILASVRVVSR